MSEQVNLKYEKNFIKDDKVLNEWLNQLDTLLSWMLSNITNPLHWDLNFSIWKSKVKIRFDKDKAWYIIVLYFKNIKYEYKKYYGVDTYKCNSIVDVITDIDFLDFLEELRWNIEKRKLENFNIQMIKNTKEVLREINKN